MYDNAQHAPHHQAWDGSAGPLADTCAETEAATIADIAPLPPAASAARRSWTTRALIATGVVCFLGGALAWHLIGFWSFVSEIVYNPDDPRTARSAPAPIGAPDGNAAIADTQQPAARAPHASDKAAATPASPSAIVSAKPTSTVDGTERPPASTETLAELLQCAEALKGDTEAVVHACPPLRRRLPLVPQTTRANRQLDATEAAQRLATGWETGISPVETGSLPAKR